MPPFGFSLFPRNAPFYDRFGELSQLLVQSSEALCALLDHYEEARSRSVVVAELENAADNVTHSIYTMMNQTFVTPIDREDIAALAQRMDDVVDYIEATATSLEMYRISEVLAPVRDLAGIVRLQCVEIDRAMKVLRRDRGLGEILELTREINRLENEGDAVFRRAMADLFDGTLDATDIIKWREVYDELEGALDSGENVSHVLEGIVLKHG